LRCAKRMWGGGRIAEISCMGGHPCWRQGAHIGYDSGIQTRPSQRRNSKMKMTAIGSLVVVLAAMPLAAGADTTAQVPPFSQNWSNIGLITVNDDWSAVPGITGFRGDALTAANDVDPRTVTAADDPGVIDVNASTNPSTFISGGPAECDGLTDNVVALQGSGTADAPYLQIYLNCTLKQDVTISYNLRDVDGSTDNAGQQFALHYRVGNSGTWTDVPDAYVADASSGPSLATLVTPVSVMLLSAVNNQPLVQLRIMTTNATGNDEFVGIDDISVTATDIPIAVNAVVWSAVKGMYR